MNELIVWDWLSAFEWEVFEEFERVDGFIEFVVEIVDWIFAVNLWLSVSDRIV